MERAPRELVRVRDARDVVDAVTRARRERLSVAARGQGHCTRGHALVSDGLVLSMAQLDHVIIDGHVAVVGAGARWDQVVRAAWLHGLTPPVLPDYLGLSVGGTLSVGGIGGASFRHGAQTDQLLELTVVTGRGELRICSPERDAALFDACRAGLGQVAIMVEARLRLVAAPMRVRVHHVTCATLEQLLAELTRLSRDEHVTSLRGAIGSGGFTIEATTDASVRRAVPGLEHARCELQDHLAYAERLFAMERRSRADGSWDGAHPWFDLFVPDARAAEVIGDALRELQELPFTGGHLMLFPIGVTACTTPLLPVYGEQLAFLFDVLPDAERDDASGLARWDAFAADVLARARPWGARPYPIGFPVATEHARWPEHFGDAWPAFCRARAAHDPDGILTPGPGVFARATLPKTLGDLARCQLSAAGRAAGCPEPAAELGELLPILTGGWDALPIAESSPWPSDLTDDGAPFELSLGIAEDGVDLRFLVEPSVIAGDSRASYRAAVDAARALESRGARLGRFERVVDLFEPAAGTHARFALWYAVQIGPKGRLFKAYFNPEHRGDDVAPELVHAALERLDLPEAAAWLAAHSASAAMPYFSLDLVEGAEARVKVYMALRDGVPEALERMAAHASNHRAGDLERWCSALPADPVDGRPPLLCCAFRGRAAPEITLHLPIRCGVSDDREALRLARACCSTEHDARLLDEVVTAVARRPLDAGRGLLTYVSLRRVAERVRVTVYLAPQPYAVAPRRAVRPLSKLGDLEHAVAAARRPYASHRFFERLAQGLSLDEAKVVAHRLAVFAMTFQDVLRQARAGCRDPAFAALMRVHEIEDSGHDHWYLSDLGEFGLSRELGDAFAQDRVDIRDASYEILRVLGNARHDATRLAVVLALEAAGKEFFHRFDAAFAHFPGRKQLRYFARSHEDVEANHHLTNALDAPIFDSPIDVEALREAVAGARATFTAMTRIASAMDRALGEAPAAPYGDSTGTSCNSNVAARVSP